MSEEEYNLFYQRIGELYQGGKSREEIAKRVGMNRSFVSAIIDEMKVRHEA